MILLSHPTGNQNSRQAALAFSEAGALSSFVTTVHVDSHNPWVRAMPASMQAELARRDFGDVARADQIASVAPLRELTRMAAQRLGWKSLIQREKGWACVDAVYHAADRAVSRRLRKARGVDTVYLYEDGALATFTEARAKGIRCVYELPIGFWRRHRRLCAEEAERHPAWAHTWHASADSDAKLRRKDEELALASQVVVPSRFVAESLLDYPGSLPPVAVVPYGCPKPISPDARRWYAGGKLRILFVGGLSQRKGITYLLDAVRPLGESVELTIIGSGPGGDLLADSQHRLLGSIPHAAVLREMRDHDIFVFPTLFEGYSLAVAEALSQGLPVITTPNSGAADIIEDGRQGWAVPIRDSATITQRLQRCVDCPELIEKMGRAALQLAAVRSWQSYRNQLRSVVLPTQNIL